MSILNESPVVGLQFSILSPDEIRRMSVVEVVNRDELVARVLVLAADVSSSEEPLL